jgi:hypothetical protein
MGTTGNFPRAEYAHIFVSLFSERLSAAISEDTLSSNFYPQNGLMQMLSIFAAPGPNAFLQD